MMKHAKTILLFCTVAFTGGCVYLNSNFRVVEDGRLYRSGQMGSQRLERTIDRHAVRTVINLRGPNPDEPWYQEELSVCQTLGVAHHDISWSKAVLPGPESLNRLVALFKESPTPILVHCQGGTHRSAVAAAVYVLLEGATVDEARQQMGAFFNDAPIGELLDLYEPSLDPFEKWAAETYPEQYRRRAVPSGPSE